MKITYFRRPIEGPERQMEELITASIPEAFNLKSHFTWVGASAPIGAGRPDLVIVTYKPEIFLLPDSRGLTTELLSYLYSVRKAQFTTIKNRMKKPDHIVFSQLQDLVDARVVVEKEGKYSLSTEWQSILPDITAIEVKVSDWRRAIQQAARNRVLAHSSYIALPANIAKRAMSDSAVSSMGLGILEIDQNDRVRVLKVARKSKPSVTSYYFKIAAFVAAH